MRDGTKTQESRSAPRTCYIIEANRSICGQTNSAGSMGLDDGRYGLYGYRLYVPGYEEIRDDFLLSNEDYGDTGCDDT